MSKELIVSAGRHETKVAILDDDQVVELFHEREKEYSLAGSIHKGRVTRVLPGMQSAFVDIGLDRDAFLYVSDFFEDGEEYDAVVSTVEEKVLKMDRSGAAEPPKAPGEAELPAAEPVAEASAPVPVPVAERREEPRREGGRPDRGAERGGGDRGGDRGGRGRRGRRRGGRSGGLPESKFFSPRNEEPRNEATQEPEPEVTSAARPVEHVARRSPDLMVLPGESLAKYSPGEADAIDTIEEEIEVAEPVVVAVEEIAAEENPVEAPLPIEHPLAGFGDISSWVADEPVVAKTVVAEPVVAEPEEASPVVETNTKPANIAPEILYPEDFGSEGKGEGLSAAEVAEAEVAGDLRRAEEIVASEEEGPEPARIPTSLTATLREQGHRYPHRVSRRMRRKGRGGQSAEGGAKAGEGSGERPGERTGEKPAAVAAPQAEDKVVSQPREDRRPERSQDRPDPRAARERPERDRPPLPSIADLLKEGQEIIVQIAKEPLGQKGARITSHIALPGRFVVYMPTVEHVGVSRKIPSDEERQRLKRVLQTHRQGIPGGFICRTAAENKSEEELKSDMHFLYNLWLDMRQKAERKPAPVLLHHDLDLVQRVLRDQLTTSFKTIWVDNEELYESILSFVERFQPALIGRVKLYTRSNPIFDEFGITSEIDKALRPKVWLKSGGYIVINQTEALVAIDINTGKYVGKSNRLEDTIVKINTDAVKEIVRQVRLRDLGGIIVVDFIDMDERKNRQKVMMALEDAMRADRAPYKILQFNDFGLVAITRKRVKQSLERTLCSPCVYCEGAGYIKSVGTVIGEILQEAQRMQKALEVEQGNVMLRVNPEVAKVLKSNQNQYMQEIEEILKRTVIVKSDPLLHQTKFDLA
jgi:ribonuclease G